MADEEPPVQQEGKKEEDSILSMATFQEPISKLDLPEIVSVDVSASVADAVQVMQTGRFGSVVVVENGKVAGILTERDILFKVTGKVADMSRVSVKNIMTMHPVSLKMDDKIIFLLQSMHSGGFRHVPIVSGDGTPTHMASIKNVMDFILRHFPEEVMV